MLITYVDRRDFVDRTYPRIAYLFSDILCFNFSGSYKEVRTVVSQLETYAQVGLAKSLNTKKPVLIVIFHKVGFDAFFWWFNTDIGPKK